MFASVKKPVRILAIVIIFMIAAALVWLLFGGYSPKMSYSGGGNDTWAAESFPMAAPAVSAEFDMADEVAFRGADGSGYYEEQAARSEERIVIKNADLSIAVPDPGEVLEQISARAEELGGFVVSSNLYQTRLESGAEVPEAHLTIRIPADLLLEMLEEIKSGANQVLSENISGQDVTREYTDLQSRLRNLQNAEVQLREIMASAIKTEDVLSVYSELSRITGEIEVVKGQINYFEQSAALSAISISILADKAVQPINIGGWEPVGVAKDAIQALIDTLQSIGSGIIWTLILILPLALLLALLFALLRWLYRWLAPRVEKIGKTSKKSEQ